MLAALLDTITAAPALVKILGAFAVILLATGLKLHMGAAMLAGSLVLGVWCGLAAGEMGQALTGALLDPGIWGLIALVSLIVVFGRALQLSGRLDRLVDGVVGRAGSRRRAAAILPAFFGLLPMPGGAYLSAPMVDTAARPDGISAERMAAINYWFRHLWEYWWPLYPGVILALDLLESARPQGINLGWFIIFEFPLTFGVFFAGRWAILGRGYSREAAAHQTTGEPETRPAAPLGPLVAAASPLLIVIALTLGWSALSVIMGSRLAGIHKSIPLSLFIILSTGLILLRDRLGWRAVPGMFRQRKILDMAAIVMGVMVFRGMIQASGAVAQMGDELAAWGIPVDTLVAALPFVAGLVTGIAVGFVGASFSVVALLMPETGSPLLYASYYVLAFGAGYVGMMLSPVHFCLVLTRQYFKADWRRVYPMLVRAAAIMLGGVITLAVLYRWLATM